MGGPVKGRKGKDGRKTIGRQKPWCEAYRRRGQRERNKAVKLARHLKHHPNDRCAVHRAGQ